MVGLVTPGRVLVDSCLWWGTGDPEVWGGTAVGRLRSPWLSITLPLFKRDPRPRSKLLVGVPGRLASFHFLEPFLGQVRRPTEETP